MGVLGTSPNKASVPGIFNPTQLADAAKQGAGYIDSALKQGTSKKTPQYPHEYQNTENLPFAGCPGNPGAKMWEFPLLASGTPWTGGAGSESDWRVVFKYDPQTS